MGIKGLTKLLSDHAPGCMREQKFEGYLDRKVAIDASMHIYQFMMVIGRSGDQTLTNEAGEVTSHLQGMFMRTCRMLEAGIKPVYVFDGKPPTMKGGELAKRKDKREAAEAELEKAKEAGDQEMIEKMSKRTVRVSKEQSMEVMKLARLMGLPVFEAPCEAEASCAALCKAGLVYAAASEDMDTLCFSCPKLARNLMAPASQGKPILEFDFDKCLQELDLTWDQFIDVCIMCGCDYCDSIKGIGPVKALQLIKKHGSIEEMLKDLDKEKYPSRGLALRRGARAVQEPRSGADRGTGSEVDRARRRGRGGFPGRREVFQRGSRAQHAQETQGGEGQVEPEPPRDLLWRRRHQVLHGGQAQRTGEGQGWEERLGGWEEVQGRDQAQVKPLFCAAVVSRFAVSTDAAEPYIAKNKCLHAPPTRLSRSFNTRWVPRDSRSRTAARSARPWCRTPPMSPPTPPCPRGGK